MNQPAVAYLISLESGHTVDRQLIGGKAWNLSRLLDAGFPVPRGVILTTHVYKDCLTATRLAEFITMELERKPLEHMRWEELWDAALRIRSAFLKLAIPDEISSVFPDVLQHLSSADRIIVRSSASDEDSGGRSFAGLHESLVVEPTITELTEGIRRVWASLWSDAALLYRKELALDSQTSGMAVVIQEFNAFSPSGVAFSRDPRGLDQDLAIIEAVPGRGSDLVDGLVEPDRWHVKRSTGTILNYHTGDRGEGTPAVLLDDTDVTRLVQSLGEVESLFGWYADVEWTGKKKDLIFIQARPITTRTDTSGEDEREWYLSLRPGSRKLAQLRDRVVEQLIPELEADGERLARTTIEQLSDRELASEISNRLALVRKWKKIYADDFIPFAHGVRQLGMYYNDAVKPDDPYEFVGLLQGERMLATRRNQTLARLAELVAPDEVLQETIRHIVNSDSETALARWSASRETLQNSPNGRTFVEEFDNLISGFMDVSYKAARLHDHPEVFLHAILEQATGSISPMPVGEVVPSGETSPAELERTLLAALPPERHQEALDIISIGRISWRLRDDDNLLIGRLESQLVRAVSLAADRLRAAGRLDKLERLNDQAAVILAEALLDPPADAQPVEIPSPEGVPGDTLHLEGKPRQLVGQPSSPGQATGIACVVRNHQDLLRFKAGNVLVCDAIQPTMTHIVPLACAIVERRGGMLIHGAIIARELQIPCVNGVAGAAEMIRDGDILAVDGHMGIVTVGPPEFEAELVGAHTHDSASTG